MGKDNSKVETLLNDPFSSIDEPRSSSSVERTKVTSTVTTPPMTALVSDESDEKLLSPIPENGTEERNLT